MKGKIYDRCWNRRAILIEVRHIIVYHNIDTMQTHTASVIHTRLEAVLAVDLMQRQLWRPSLALDVDRLTVIIATIVRVQADRADAVGDLVHRRGLTALTLSIARESGAPGSMISRRAVVGSARAQVEHARRSAGGDALNECAQVKRDGAGIARTRST